MADRSPATLKETELYPFIKEFLQGQGYQVKGEVQQCDVVAVRGDDDPVVVELKLSFNLEVVLQAVDRLALTPKVYIATLAGRPMLKKRRKRVLKMLRMLGIGLLVIDPNRRNHNVEVLVDPLPYTPRKSRVRGERLLGEFLHRVGDPNPGGSGRRKGIMTVYRQRALAIGRYLVEQGPTKASQVASALGDPKAREILYRNVYGWFERVSLGTYAVSPRGKQELDQWPDL